MLHVRLDAAQEERAKDAMQPCHRIFVVDVLGAEERVEGIGIGEHLREEEVQQRPQLVEVVLERCAGEEEAALDVEAADADGEG